MIRNLNQVSFQGFGTIFPERAHAARIMDKGGRQSMQLENGEVPVYRALSETWLGCGTHEHPVRVFRWKYVLSFLSG